MLLILDMLKVHRQISRNDFPKSIVHVTKHTNFHLYRAHPDRVIWKNSKMTANINKRFQPFIHVFKTYWVEKIIST